MKITCPICQTSYEIAKFIKPVARAVCKKCRANLVINRDSGEVEAGELPQNSDNQSNADSTDPPDFPSVISTGTADEEDAKDYLAIGILAAALCLLLGSGYYLVKNVELDFLSTPARYFSKKIKGSDRVDACNDYLLRNRKMRDTLGKDLNLSLLREKVYVTDGNKTARLTIKVKGSRDSRNVRFLLKKEKRGWRVVSAEFITREEKPRRPTPKDKKIVTKRPPAVTVEPAAKPVPKETPPPPPPSRPVQMRLPKTTTNEQLAEVVRNNPEINTLHIDRCSNLTDVSSLAQLTRLSELSMTWCVNVGDVSPLAKLKGLKKLHLHKCDSLSDLSPLTNLGSLVELSLPPNTTDPMLAKVIPHLPLLENLSINSCYQVTDLSPLSHLKSLTRLHLDHAHNLANISPLADLSRLEVLHLTYTRVSDLTPLANLSDLTRLWLWGNKNLTNISPLGSLSDLTVLGLNGCKGVRDISPLAKLTVLKTLDLSRLSEIRTVSPLSGLTQLKKLDLRGCDKISRNQIETLKKSLPGCLIRVSS